MLTTFSRSPAIPSDRASALEFLGSPAIPAVAGDALTPLATVAAFD